MTRSQKHPGERYVHITLQRADLDLEFQTTSFRLYNVYGPWQALDNPYQGVLGIFLGNLLSGELITIFGDREQSGDFVYVSNAVDAWAGALENPASYGKVFNLGSGRRLSINHVVDAALSAFGRTRAHRLATLSRYNLVLKIENAKAAFLPADVIPQGTPAEC
jgi:UDP-glucose 4-epimerase